MSLNMKHGNQLVNKYQVVHFRELVLALSAKHLGANIECYRAASAQNLTTRHIQLVLEKE